MAVIVHFTVTSAARHHDKARGMARLRPAVESSTYGRVNTITWLV